jgi:hypothetical protein
MKLPTLCSLMASACLALVVPGNLETSDTSHSGLLVERQSVPTSGGVPLINTVNTWRSRYKLPSLTWDTTLAEYALDATSGWYCGGDIRTSLKGNTLAQVWAGGIESNTKNWDLQGGTPFGLAYTSWLCSRPTEVLTNDNGVDRCALLNRYFGYQMGKNPGLSDILTRKEYKRIGCAFKSTKSDCGGYHGWWVCNLN